MTGRMTRTARSLRDHVGHPFRLAAGVVGILLSLVVVYYAINPTSMPRRMMANLVLGAGVFIYYFERAHERRTGAEVLAARDKLAVGGNAVAAVAGLLAASYVHLNYYRWVENSRLLVYNNVDLLVGAAIMLLVLDITYRSFGRAITGAVLLALAYGVLGASLPGFLQHRGLSIAELIARETIVLGGVYGSLLQIAATWVAIFILFAGFVEAHGGFDYIHRLGLRVGTLSRSGVAQSSVISSMVIGMLTGGAAVNVALTGSFTIPLMKDNNIPPRIAGAIESMASSGGQILPPIMGLAAFLIADFIGVQYADVVVAALLPAVLFYGLIAVSVHILIVSSGWVPRIDQSQLDENLTGSLAAFLLEGLQFLLPLAVLMYMLVGLELPIMLAGSYTIAAFLLLRALFNVSPLSDEAVTAGTATQFVVDSIEGLRAASDTDASLRVTVGERVDDNVLSAVRDLAGVDRVDRDGDDALRVACDSDAKTRVVTELEARGVSVTDFTTEEASLEDLFLAYTERAEDVEATGADDETDDEMADDETDDDEMADDETDDEMADGEVANEPDEAADEPDDETAEDAEVPR